MKQLHSLLVGAATAASIAHLPVPPFPGTLGRTVPFDVVKTTPQKVTVTQPDRASMVRAVLLTAAAGERSQPAQRYAFLNCEPVGGSHPSAAEACRILGQAMENGRDDLARFDVNPGAICPMIWQPVTVTMSGIWNGKYVSMQHTFGNDCQRRAATGGLFDT
ncbi:hypothetical protein JOL79_06235 [Microbispora sp. RL4-1S]|uniref:Subtilisin inhibitor domain-containing protein n=1 Tax=Microbispora oryzae TaxID=2806554 RepID=A0A940WG24_9ACTN|nr:SSI family serine proteinase inhibitor [Microbispora oryzae]MBP2703397.1 hypothetical protein [Microbispora oryzae]